MKNMKKFARKCDHCGKVFNEWYHIDNWYDEYFCSDECLKAEHTEEEIKSFEIWEDRSESYWTEWEDDSDMQYYEDWTEIEEEEEEEQTDKQIIYNKIADLYDYVQDSDTIEKERILDELANIQQYAK